MSSRLMIRSCGSSIRNLISRHLRPTVAATIGQTETPWSIYNWKYLLSVPQTVYFSRGFSNDAVGYSMLKEAACERRNENFDEASVTEDEDEDYDDIEMYDPEYGKYDPGYNYEFDSDGRVIDRSWGQIMEEGPKGKILVTKTMYEMQDF
ncbi:hypothetical protein Lser_V15G45321 [Lactuca serriola]